MHILPILAICALLAAGPPSDAAPLETLLVADDGISEECRPLFLETPRHKALDCAAVRQSYLYSPECGATRGHWPLFDFLVTGTPRSGTVYTYALMKRLGLRIDNDWVVPRGRAVSSWILAFNDTDPFGPVRQLERRFRRVFHQVREPLASITSIACATAVMRPDFVRFVQRHVRYPHAEWHAENPVKLAMQFYVGWQEYLDRLPVPIHRLEDLEAPLVRCILEAALGPQSPLPPLETIRETIGHLSRHTNARPHRPRLSWPDLRAADEALARRMWALAQRFGYEDPRASLDEHPSADRAPTCARHAEDNHDHDHHHDQSLLPSCEARN